MKVHPIYGDVHRVKELADGRDIVVVPLAHGYAAICTSRRNSPFRDGYWQYQRATTALAAAEAWDGTGEPDGWYRHPATGRRRPDGDPEREVFWP